MKKEDITRKAEQSSIERYPIFISEGVDVNYSMRMEHGYAFELGATWMEEYANQSTASEEEKLRTVLRQAIRELRRYTIKRPSMKTDIIIDKLWEQYKNLTTKQ